MEQVQGTAACSLILPHLLQDPWSCVQGMHSECDAPCKLDLAFDKARPQRLLCNDRAMIRQICNVKPEGVATVRSNELLAQLEIDDLNVILKEKRLCWFQHVERPAIKTACNKQIDGKRGPRRPTWPKMSWKTLTERDRPEWNLNKVEPCNKDVWRSSVRSVMCAAIQLPGGEPTDVDDAPALAC